jgi:hypothetical protein
LEIASFIFFLLIFSTIITNIPFVKYSGMGKGPLILAFYAKIVAGIAYARFYRLPGNYNNSDTWRFYRLSLEETEQLKHNPFSFFKDLFHSGYYTRGNIFSGQNTYWNDLKSNVVIKIMALFNLLTYNSYYTNIILFNFLFIIGLVAIFKILFVFFPEKKWPVFCVVFFLPSTLFWCSGIHKDGLILSAVGILLYCFNKLIIKEALLKHKLFILLSCIFIFSLRSYVFFALLPSLLFWYLAARHPGKQFHVFFTIYLPAILFVLIIPYVFPTVNILSFIVEKQQEFLKLQGGSLVKTDPLQPTPFSFILFLPQAIDMAFFQPHPTEIKNLSYVPAIAENIFVILLIIISLLNIPARAAIPPFVICLITFSISILLICGYTVPFSGAVIRYKSLVLPLLITPLLCLADFSFLSRRYNR